MKHRLLLALMICVSVLAGCYRQAEEEFQQVNSSEVEQVGSAAAVVTAVQMSESGVLAPDQSTIGDAVSSDGEAPAPASEFITPEPPPGQVVQLTNLAPTSIVVIAATPGEVPTRGFFTLPTPTETLEETLDPDDECVYSVVSGDNLFRLSIVFETTVDALLQVNELESDALQIGQLLLIPDCERTEPEATPMLEPAADAGPGDAETAAEDSGALPEESAVERTLQLSEGSRYHVVSAGETWASIALRYGLDIERIPATNQLASTDQLVVGQELVLPEEAADITAKDATLDDATEDSEASEAGSDTSNEG